MTDSEEIFKTPDGRIIQSADDVPASATMLARQRLIYKWFRIATLVPVIIVMFLAFNYFPSGDPTAYTLILSVVIWSLLVVGVTMFLQFKTMCPACGVRFGLRNECRNCGLPRFAGSRSAPEIPSEEEPSTESHEE